MTERDFMKSKLRTILICLLSLAAALAMYLAYSRASKTPQVDIDLRERSFDAVSDSNVGEFDNEIGKFANVGIGGVKKPVFRHISNGRIDREFGFEELLRENKGEWEVEKPFLNIYQNNFKCFVTANEGKVQIEDAVGRLSPKDATFTGNVIVHILPEAGSDIKESFVYLNDVIFISEKSLLSTAGPVRFVSQDAQMLGTGMEMIYNDQLERMELFRIVHLATLQIKASQVASFSQATLRSNNQAQPGNEQAQPTIVDHAQERNGTPITVKQAVKQKRGEYYKCVLSTNVVIDSPEQLILAEDRISINNIFWSRESNEEPEKVEENKEAKEDIKAEEGTKAEEDKKISSATTSADGVPSQPAQELRDTIITCDNGIFIIPMNSTIIQNDFIQSAIDKNLIATKPPMNLDDDGERTILITDKIDYDATTDNTIATGPLELTLLAPATGRGTPAEGRELKVPINIKARKEAIFLSLSKQVTFEGDCVCTMNREEPNDIGQKYTLSAPKLIVNLSSNDLNTESSIEHITADGGAVKLQSVKTIKGELFSGVDLECQRIDHDVGKELFIATGPGGAIRLNNSKVPDPNQQQSGFSLRRPCYAFLRNFASLKYFIKDNLIISDAEPGQTLLINYFPVVEGSYGQQVKATAAHTEVDFVQTADGQSELSMLIASGGITYKEDDGNELMGSKLFYDREKSILRVEGDEAEPCYFNGALVEKILYDPKTGKFEAPLVGPGTLQIK
jgi:hypothetical protein